MSIQNELLAIAQQLDNCAFDLNNGEVGRVASKLRALAEMRLAMPKDVSEMIELLREQYTDTYKDEQAPDVIYNYELDRAKAADTIETLQAHLNSAFTSDN